MDWASSLSRMQQHDILATGLKYLSTISPAHWCQMFYLSAAGCVLIVASTPAEARTLLINYGARKASPSKSAQAGTPTPETQPQPSGINGELQPGKDQDGQSRGKVSTGQGGNQSEASGGEQRPNIFVSLIALVTSYGQVPHSWFLAFYVVSVLCSIFWGSQYLLILGGDGADEDGGWSSMLRTIAAKQAASSSSSSSGMITNVQLFVAWNMMFLQGTRRVYEHLVIMRPSKSTMWFVHWVLGLGYYVVTNVAVWVEGADTILAPQKLSPALLLSEALSPSLLPKLLIAIPTFLYAYAHQYLTHTHLASLRKYSLPSTDPRESGTSLFNYLICPHYTCECLLYLAIAITASPSGQWINKTLLCGLVFVVVNLGVTARGTRAWYVDKFGAESVKGKWNMIPFVF